MKIFQTWKTKTDVNPVLEHWSESWKRHHPGYEYELWDDNDCYDFISNNYPWFLQKYMSYSDNIYRADAVRYFYLYHYGGIYVDIDTMCLQNFDRFILEHSDDDVIFGSLYPDGVSNALIISKPRQDFWLSVFYIMLNTEHIPGNAPICETGNELIQYCINNYNKVDIRKATWYPAIWRKLAIKPIEQKTTIEIVDDKYFYSINCNLQLHQDLYRKSVFVDKRIFTEEEMRSDFPEALSVTFWMNSF